MLTSTQGGGGEIGSKRHNKSVILIQFMSPPIYICSVLQRSRTMSSTEAEYMAVSKASNIILWLCQSLTG